MRRTGGKLFVAMSVVAFGFASVVAADDGELDAAFSLDGWAVVDFDLDPERDDYVWGASALADGKIAVAGSAYGSIEGTLAAVTRLRADGSQDPTFSEDGRLTFRFQEVGAPQVAYAVLAHPDAGKLVVVGGFSGDDDRVGLARLLENGDFDPAFGDLATPGRAARTLAGVSEIFLRAAAIFGAGRILVAGSAIRAGGAGRDGFVARFDENGDLDTIFGDQGVVWLAFDRGGTDDDEVKSLAVQDDGKIVALLRVETDDALGDVDTGIVRLDATGDPDAQFGGIGEFDPGFAYFQLTDLFGATADTPESVAVQPDGRIVFAGANAGSTGGYRCYLGRLLPTGGTDSALAAELIEVEGESWSYCQEIVVQSDGRLLLAGSTLESCFAIRLDEDGQAPDPTFGTAGQTILPQPPSSEINCVGAAHSGERLVLAGTTFNSDAHDDFYVARLTSDLIFADGFESGTRAQWSGSS